VVEWIGEKEEKLLIGPRLNVLYSQRDDTYSLLGHVMTLLAA
jgi:hypothetical protein